MGGATEKHWPRRPSDHQLQETPKKTDRAITPEAEAVRVPAHLMPPGSPQAKQLSHLHTQLSLGQSCHGEKCLAFMHGELLRLCPTLRPCKLWPARLLCQGGGFSRQEHWSILANTGCHTLLEHYISFCPSHPPLSTWCCQNPCNPSSRTTSTPGPHRGKPKSSRAASGSNPSG